MVFTRDLNFLPFSHGPESPKRQFDIHVILLVNSYTKKSLITAFAELNSGKGNQGRKIRATNVGHYWKMQQTLTFAIKQ